MNDNTSKQTCPGCGNAIDPSTVHGLCAHCLMNGAAADTLAGISTLEPLTLEQAGKIFHQLEVLELIGQGGMGAVFKVRQPKLDRFAALKLLPLSLNVDEAFSRRFEREARLLARLSHPNIVSVYDYGQAGDFFYLLMEYVDGVNLRQAMHASRFEPRQALEIIPRICDALQYAHDEGVLHRDIKPENILLDIKGRVKLVDFGIAKLTAESETLPPGGSKNYTSHTQAGVVMGTPSYMAPEQRDHPADVDHRADIYSLGVVFYELLTGELPAGAIAKPSQKSDADPRVDAVVQQALEKQRERRQRSAGEVRTQVETISGTNRRAIDSQPPVLAMLAASFWGLSGVVAIIALFKMPNPPQIAVWTMLSSAILAVVCALPVRLHLVGRRVLLGGLANITIWFAVMAVGLFFSPRKSATQVQVSADVRYRVFEVDTETVDHLIPLGSRQRSDAVEPDDSTIFSAESGSAQHVSVERALLSANTLQALLQTMDPDPGLMNEATRKIIMWPRQADSFSSSSNQGSAGGSGFIGLMRGTSPSPDNQTHLKLRLQFHVSLNSSNVPLGSDLFYEGDAPTGDDAFGFLIPFKTKDSKSRYVVIAYDILGANNSPESPPVPVTAVVVQRGDLRLFVRALGNVQSSLESVAATQPNAKSPKTAVEFDIPQENIQAVIGNREVRPTLYRIQAGDVLSVSIRDLEGTGKESVKQVRVSETGEIGLPYLTGVPVAGLTESELRTTIVKAYRSGNILSDPQVLASVLQAGGHAFNKLGTDAEPGPAVEIFNRDHSKKLATGILVGVDKKVDSNTGALRCMADVLPTSGTLLYPNQMVTVQIVSETRHNVVTVPVSALLAIPSGTVVFAIDSGQIAKARTVVAGLVEDDMVQIIAGLSPGETVVANSNTPVYSGCKVRVMSTPAMPTSAMPTSAEAK